LDAGVSSEHQFATMPGDLGRPQFRDLAVTERVFDLKAVNNVPPSGPHDQGQ
jgi:hypothetical protein